MRAPSQPFTFSSCTENVHVWHAEVHTRKASNLWCGTRGPQHVGGIRLQVKGVHLNGKCAGNVFSSNYLHFWPTSALKKTSCYLFQALLAASILLGVESVKEACCRFLMRRVDEKRCIGTYSFAAVHTCTMLAQHCMEYIIEHFSDIYQQVSDWDITQWMLSYLSFVFFFSNCVVLLLLLNLLAP